MAQELRADAMRRGGWKRGSEEGNGRGVGVNIGPAGMEMSGMGFD